MDIQQFISLFKYEICPYKYKYFFQNSNIYSLDLNVRNAIMKRAKWEGTEIQVGAWLGAKCRAEIEAPV